MNLLQIRQKFRELSGRFDLVNEDYSDNGADFFINEGRKFLDRLNETQKSWASCFRFIEIGYQSATFPYCRAIKEVWVMTSTSRWQLEKVSLQELISEYLAEMPTARSTGTPIYYSPTLTRFIPENPSSITFESFIGWVDIPSGNVHNYNAILLDVPVSERMAVEVKGLYYSAELLNNTDKNFWSEVHPMLLIMSAMRYTEVINRNSQGVNDWNISIETEMKQLGMDLVEEFVAEIDQMEG